MRDDIVLFNPRASYRIRMVILIVALLSATACNQGLGAFQAGVGNTPKRPPGTSFRVLGQTGVQFSAVVSDSQSSWTILGSIPFNVIIVHNTTPVRMIVTKQSPGSGILSVQLTTGFTVKQVASTTAPYGIVSVQSQPQAPGFAPPPAAANPDLRIFVKGPLGERFSGLVEDKSLGFIVSDRVPALILFDQPNGAIDGTFNQIQNFGPFDIDMFFNGGLVAHVSGGPSVTIRQP